MAYSFLQLVNKTLRDAREIAGDQGELASFDDSARGSRIDTVRQVWLDVVQELFDLSNTPSPQECIQSTITLVEGTSSNSWGRDYQLPTNLIQIRWPLIDESGGYTIREYPGGYEAMRKNQLQPRQFTGRPQYGCIEPIMGYLRIDTDPLAEDAGLAYTMTYDRYIKPYHEFDLMPFADNVSDALVPCTTEYYNRIMKGSFDAPRFAVNLARAARELKKVPMRDRW